MAKRTRKPTERETALENQLSDLQLQRMAAIWMLKNGQPFTPEAWICIPGPRVSRLLARTDESGFPSDVWHEATLTPQKQRELLERLSMCDKDAEWHQCAHAIHHVVMGVAS